MITGENEIKQNIQADKALKNQKKASEENQRIIDSYDYLTNAASSQDCTGLIPSAPLNEEELESYNALYKFQPPKVPSVKKEKNSQEQTITSGRPLRFLLLFRHINQAGFIVPVPAFVPGCSSPS